MAGAKKKIVVLMTASMSGAGFNYIPGDHVKVEKDIGEAWANAGYCSLEIPEIPVKEHPVERRAAEEKEVIAAIAKMDPEKDYDNRRKPDLKKLEDELDKCVGINMRNACFDTYLLMERDKRRNGAGSEGELVEEK